MNNKGFTLIELLAVLVIISALLAIAIPLFDRNISIDNDKYEYVDLDGNKGYSSNCYEDDGLFCKLDGGIIQVKQFKRN